MWMVMMTAMMLPSAVPLLSMYIAVVRRTDERAVSRTYLLAAGYLAIWAVFSAAATLAQRVLTDRSVVSPMMNIADVRIAAVLLLVVAAYQFTPVKRDCLDACRSPFLLFTRYWRVGAGGAFRLGVRHGLYCLGCCWALMLLLFAGGVMNPYVIGGLTLFVFIERATPIGRAGSKIGGVFLALFAVWLLVM
jgi:predicted metal-binding membrane protein